MMAGQYAALARSCAEEEERKYRMRIARVFPRRTAATPDDLLAFTSTPPKSAPVVDEVHVSVAFTYDIPKAERLAKAWMSIGVPVKVGGPAYESRGEEFVPGLYLKPGYVITSRGCPNNCGFCFVPKREGKLREISIKDGWNVLDDNLLACSDEHIKAVFAMLSRQPHLPQFTGGLEATRLKPWHAELLRESKAERMYFAYDMPKKYEALVEAGKILRTAGITRASHKAMCYVLIGCQDDTFDRAEKRLCDAARAGFMPFAMLFRGEDGVTDVQWERFQREWANPIIVGSKLKSMWL